MKYLTHEWVNTVLIVLVGILVLVGGNQSVPTDTLGATGTRFPNGLSTNSISPAVGELLTTTLQVDSTSVFEAGVTFDTTATFTGVASFNAMPVLNAGVNNSYSLATTTSATTYTLLAADIGNYDTIRQILSGGATTFTLPASSTLTALVPAAGDRAETCWMPITNNLVFAAGTGIDIMVATSTNNGGGAYDLTITAGGVGCIQWFRQTDTDITAGLIEYENAD